MHAFYPYLLASLKISNETRLCIAAAAAVSNLAEHLGNLITPISKEILDILLHNLQVQISIYHSVD
jgi:hypothetical protein